MNERDDEALLEAFRRRMSGIERDVPEPPPANARATPRAAPPLIVRAAGTLAAVGVLVALAVLLVTVAPRARPGPGADVPSPLASGPPADGDELITIDEVTLSEDGQSVRLDFVGGPPFDPLNACSNDYAAWAAIVDDHLEVAVFVVEHATVPLLPMQGCPDIGYNRSLQVDLAAPFTGHRVVDRSGSTHFVARPPDLVEIDLPERWQLVAERGLPGSRTGQWRRTYSVHAPPPPVRDGGRLDLYQTFDAPAGVSGDVRQPPLIVDGNPAILYRSGDGELVLVWRFGEHGLALVANEADFSVAELVTIAESARLPGGATVPPGVDEPPERVIACGRHDPEPCQLAIEVVSDEHPAEVDAADAIVVDDVCPPTVICDRLYPFMSAVVLVTADGAGKSWRAYLVVGDGYVPERVFGPAETLPAHILEMIADLP